MWQIYKAVTKSLTLTFLLKKIFYLNQLITFTINYIKKNHMIDIFYGFLN